MLLIIHYTTRENIRCENKMAVPQGRTRFLKASKLDCFYFNIYENSINHYTLHVTHVDVTNIMHLMYILHWTHCRLLVINVTLYRHLKRRKHKILEIELTVEPDLNVNIEQVKIFF